MFQLRLKKNEKVQGYTDRTQSLVLRLRCPDWSVDPRIGFKQTKKEGILKWYGDGENKPKDSDQPKSFYDEDDKFWMEYEEDDEANAKGSVIAQIVQI